MVDRRLDASDRRMLWVAVAQVTVVLIMSLGLRLDSLDVYLTADEHLWHSRSIAFRNALMEHDLASTYQRHHPGVLTMWSGTLAAELIESIGGMDATQRVAHRVEDGRVIPPGVQPLTTWARGVIGVVTWLGIITLIVLVRQVFGNWIALFSLALVALDPFFLAHSRVHHLDALVTIFISISVMSYVLAERKGLHAGYMALSGAMAGLAFVNKASAGFLVPWLALALIAQLAFGAQARGNKVERSRLGKLIGLGLLWGILMAAAFVVVWPAMWVDPAGTISAFVDGSMREGTTPHGLSNFFWGTVRADPGVMFYPMAWLLRATPWAVVGLLLSACLGLRRREGTNLTRALWLFVAVFGLATTLSAKKFDRYLLPVFPVLNILAAYGWYHLLARLGGARVASQRGPLMLGFIGAMVVSQFMLIWPNRPYYLAYYNPLTGGTRAASNQILVGWGEGLDMAARYLNDKPDADQLLVASQNTAQFSMFFAGRSALIRDVALVEPDYFVLYSNRLQRQFDPEVTSLLSGQTPEYVASVNGLEYARVYPNTFYRDELEAILQAIEAETEMSNPLVLFNCRPAMTRTYPGPLRVAGFRELPEDQTIIPILNWAFESQDRMWFVTIDGVYEDTREVVERLILTQGGEVGQRIVIGNVVATRYDVQWQPLSTDLAVD